MGSILAVIGYGVGVGACLLGINYRESVDMDEVGRVTPAQFVAQQLRLEAERAGRSLGARLRQLAAMLEGEGK